MGYFKKWKKKKKKKNEKKTGRYNHFTHVYQTLWLDEVWFLRYGARQTDKKTDGKSDINRGGCPSTHLHQGNTKCEILHPQKCSEMTATSPSDFEPASSKELLDIQATMECGFTLKWVRDMTRTYSHFQKYFELYLKNKSPKIT